MSATNDAMTAPKAPAMTTATARSTTSPRRMKSRESLEHGVLPPPCRSGIVHPPPPV